MYSSNQITLSQPVTQTAGEFEDAAMGALHIAAGIGHIQLHRWLIRQLRLTVKNPGELEEVAHPTVGQGHGFGGAGAAAAQRGL